MADFAANMLDSSAPSQDAKGSLLRQMVQIVPIGSCFALFDMEVEI